MRPSQYPALLERRFGRTLTDEERLVIHTAGEACASGKRDTLKAMRRAARELGLLKDEGPARSW